MVDPRTTRKWRHRKRGSIYAEVGRPLLQASTGPVGEAATLVVYRDDRGRLWAREEGEFEDGRFEAVEADAPPVSTADDALLVLAGSLDHPSVYMGGPSAHSRRKAQRLVEALDAAGFAIVRKEVGVG